MRNRMLTAVFGLLLFPGFALAQSEWLVEETGVALEVRHPVLEDLDDDLKSILNNGYFLSGRFQLPMGFAVVGELPIGYASYTDVGLTGDEDVSETTIGNVYLGVEIPVALGLATVELGTRLPTQSELGDDDFSTGVGFFSSLVDRYDAFLDDMIAPHAGVQFGLSATDLIGVSANLGATYLIFTGDNAEDNDFVLDGGVRAFVGPGATRAGAGLEGMAVLTGDEDFSDRTFYQLGLWLDHDFGMVRPGVSFFLPLDEDYKDFVDYVVGLSLQLSLP